MEYDIVGEVLNAVNKQSAMEINIPTQEESGNTNKTHNGGTTSQGSEWPSSQSLQTINAGEGVEKREPPYTVDKNISWCSLYRKSVWRFLEKLKTKLPYDPAIPLLGIYADKILIQNDPHTLLFRAELFTVAKT